MLYFILINIKTCKIYVDNGNNLCKLLSKEYRSGVIKKNKVMYPCILCYEIISSAFIMFVLSYFGHTLLLTFLQSFI